MKTHFLDVAEPGLLSNDGLLDATAALVDGPGSSAAVGGA